MKFTQVAAATLLAWGAASAQAKPVWQDFSVTGLYGENYEVVDEKQATLTVEYAAKVKYADVFFSLTVCVVPMILNQAILNFHHV